MDRGRRVGKRGNSPGHPLAPFGCRLLYCYPALGIRSTAAFGCGWTHIGSQPPGCAEPEQSWPAARSPVGKKTGKGRRKLGRKKGRMRSRIRHRK